MRYGDCLTNTSARTARMLAVEVTFHRTAQPAHADEPDEVLQDTRSSAYIKRVRAIYEYAAQVQRSGLCPLFMSRGGHATWSAIARLLVSNVL
jgi:hypothetical protein